MTPNNLSFRAQRGICICALSLSALVAAQDLPPSWRRPSPTETSDGWRQKSPTRFLRVKGDFDNDGKSDIAEILVNPSSNQFALFVKLSSAGKWQLVGQPYDVKSLDRLGIDYVKPGKYETACGKGYGDYACAHGEPESLKLSTPAIDMFYTESSDSIVYWDSATKAFREVLVGD
jgi:hypothetical protein